MNRAKLMTWLAPALAILATAPPAPAAAPEASAEPLVREIFVPFDELPILLNNDVRRVFLSRAEYAELLGKAAEMPEADAPHDAVVLSASYAAKIEDRRAKITGTIEVELVNDGLHAVPLPLANVGVRAATLDGAAAALGQTEQGVTLFIQGKGRKRIALDLVTPLQTSAAQQMLNFQLPQPPATRFHLTVPGNVELKNGASVIHREVDASASVTRFELMLPPGHTSLVMSLNNRMLQRQRVVVARSVLLDEVTTAYERLHVTVSLDVLHGAAKSFRFSLPDGFEPMHVEAPLLARWEVVEGQDQRELRVILRESVTESVNLQIAATRIPARLTNWTMPKLTPLDVAGQVTIVGLVVEDRLKTESLAYSRLTPLDNAVLEAALPETVFAAEATAPRVRSVATYYAPGEEFSLSADFQQPPARFEVTTNVLLTMTDTGHHAKCAFVISPEIEKQHELRIAVPAGWHVDSMKNGEGNSLHFERFAEADGQAWLHVRLDRGVPIGKSATLLLEASSVPAGWLGDWQQRQVAFPRFVALEAAADEGALAIDADDDFTVRPERLKDVMPLDENEKAKYGLGGVPSRLAYRYDRQPYEAVVTVTRQTPSITARNFSFLRLAPDGLTAHYELVYDIRRARTRQLSFTLPPETPPSISIAGLDGVALKEFDSEDVETGRRWTVSLSEAAKGVVRLAVDFQQPGHQESLQKCTLPLPQANGVYYESGIAAVEGHADLDITVATTARMVDVGELAAADYSVGKRLLGDYSYVGTPPELQLEVHRRPGYELRPAIVQRAELLTQVSAAGRAQTVARYQLLTKVQFLEMELPPRPVLWSVCLDGKPVAPQSEGQRLLLSLPSASANSVRDLQIVFETPCSRIGLSGDFQILAPKLLLREDRDSVAKEVPAADLVWRLRLPEGYELVGSAGTVFTDQLDNRRYRDPRRSPEAIALEALYFALGGFVPPIQAARESASRSRVASNADYAQSVAPGDYGGEYAEEYESAYDEMQDSKAAENEPVAEAPVPPPTDAPAGDTGVGGGIAGGGGGYGGQAESSQYGGYGVQAGQTASAATRSPVSGLVEAPKDQPTLPRGSRLARQAAEAQAIPATVLPRPAVPRRSWALEGLRSLHIDLLETGQEIVFRSLGVEPRLQVSVIHRQRIESLAWGMAGLVLLAGILLSRRRLRTKTRYVVLAMISALVLPALLGMSDHQARIFDAAFYAACGLVPYYLLVGALRWIACCCRMSRPAQPPTATTVLLAGMLTLVASGSLHAQDRQPRVVGLSDLVDVLVPAEPVKLPEDAVIIPYRLEDGTESLQQADRVLVPYAKYVELWNRAFPDQRIQTEPLPAAYSLAGAAYQITLSDDEDLLARGQLQIDVFSEHPVQVPLRLEGGVLESATVDGQPARLQLIQAAQLAANSRSQQPAHPTPNAPTKLLRQQTEVPSGDRFAVLHVSGVGRKQLELTVRMKLDRRGGWRLAAGRLPAAPATSLTVTVPDAHTELRLSDVPDRVDYETASPDEVVHTALPADGRFGLQWRPKVAQGEVDQSLTVQSEALLDVREDRLRLIWQLHLEFPRSQRDTFTVLAPAEYLVEKVAGNNVRGWSTKDQDGQQRIEVTLLKGTQGAEDITLHLSRRDIVQPEATSQFNAPVVSVEGASLHRGRLTVRRSPLLELTIAGVAGLSRTNIDDKSTAALLKGTEQEENALGIQPYQAYEFSNVPFVMPIQVAPLASEATAVVHSVLRIAEREAALESLIRIRVQGRPVHQLRMTIPHSLEIERLEAPGEFNWAVTKEQERRLLSIYLGQGQEHTFDVVVQGSLGQRTASDPVDAPRLTILDVTDQQGDVVVQLDPAFAVQISDKTNCDTILLDRVRSWLADEQRSLARLALHYDRPDFAARFTVTPRTPRVSGYTVTNVKVTDVAIEDTIIIDLAIQDAGIRQASILLPDWMKEPRIQAPMLRQQTIENAGDGYIRVRLELQAEILPQYRVLIEHDRLLDSDGTGQAAYDVPIPILENVRTDQRYVTLEEAGRDQVVIVDQVGVEPLARQQAKRRWLAKILGDGITDAFRVKGDVDNPKLTFKTEALRAVQTAGAQIGLAETTLVVDANGAYRGRQTYHVNNTTEQFLVIRLPAGASLWTATVAGEPVKPTRVPAQSGATSSADSDSPSFIPGQVGIPLIKTAEGDRDYAVVLKYGGQVEPLRNLRQVSFPLIHTVNIRVEMSQVRLCVPESYRWFDFGGTMRPVYDEGEFQSGFFVYNAKQVDRLMQVWSGGNAYARLRVANNLKSIGSAVRDYQAANPDLMGNDVFNKQYYRNAEVVEQAQRQADEALQLEEREVVLDNRTRLNSYWREQNNGVARNVVTDMAPNFSIPTSPDQPPAAGAERFNYRWLDNNRLKTADGQKAEQKKRLETQPAQNQKQQRFQRLNENNYFYEAVPPQKGPDIGEQASEGKPRQQILSQRELAREYRERLERMEQQAEQQIDQNGEPGVSQSGNITAGRDRPVLDQRRGQGIAQGQALGEPAASGERAALHFFEDGKLPPQVTGGRDATVWAASEFASLDVELPNVGTELLFTMARGDIQITARPVDHSLIERSLYVAVILVIALALRILYGGLRRLGPVILNTRTGAAVLLIVALLCLFLGIFPVAALIGTITGIVQLIRLSISHRRQAAATAPA